MRAWTRWRHGARAALTPLAANYAQPAVAPANRLLSTEFLALDIETTGLDFARDQILSIGWVVLQRGRVCLRESGHLLIRGHPVGQSATIHGLIDADIAQGVSFGHALETLLALLPGRVLVAHCAQIEVHFITRACRAAYGIPPLLQVIDTMAVEARLRRHEPQSGDALRLHACRERYHLPAYRAHNAAVDALACGELLLAQVAHLGEGADPELRQLGMY